MIINKIELQGFSSYKEYTEVPFDDGIYGIVGRIEGAQEGSSNGSGKSSLIMSIIYALFGEGEYDTLDDIVNDKLDKKDTMFVRLNFSISGNRYLCERGRQNGSSYLDFFENGNRRGGNIKDSQSEIISVIGMDYDMFTASTFFEQSKSDKFINVQPEQRRSYLDKVLGLSVWRDAHKNSVKDLKNSLAHRDSLKEDIKNIESEVTRIEKEISIIPQIESLILELRGKRACLEEEKQKFSNSMAQLSRYNSLIKEKSDLENKYKKIEKEIQDSEAKIPVNYKLLSDFEQKLIELKESKSLELEIKENKEKISANEIIEKDLNNKISHLSSDLGKIEANIDLNKKLRDGVHAGECPTCFNEISNEYVDNIHNKFNETINSFMLEKENKEIEINNIKKELSEISKTNSSLKSIVSEHEKYNINLIKQKSDVESKISNMGVLIESIKNDISLKKEILESISVNLMKVNNEIAQINIDDALNAEKNINRIDSLIKSVDDDMTINNKKLGALFELKNRNEKLKSEVNDKKTDLNATEDSIFFLEEVSKAFLNIPTSIFNKSVILIQDYANDFISNIFPNIRVRIYEDDSKFKRLVVKFEVNGITRSYKRLSGGQKSVCNICLRFGFSRVISDRAKTPMNLVVLDEPFSALDKVNRDLVQTVIASMRKIFTQIFVITHTDDVENYPNIIRVKMLPDGTSHIE